VIRSARPEGTSPSVFTLAKEAGLGKQEAFRSAAFALLLPSPTPAMNKKERVRAALAGHEVDRVPASFWGHDYLREWSPRGLADAMIEPFFRYDWDFMKVNPRATYYAEAWGARFEPSNDSMRGPRMTARVLNSEADLDKVSRVDGSKGPFAEQLHALDLIRADIGEADFIQTVFSPLSVVGYLAGRDLEAVRGWMSSGRGRVHAALKAIAETLADYAVRCLDAGASGIFFATTDWGTTDNLSPELYAEFGRPYDLEVLAAVRGADFNVLHVCRARNMLDSMLDYPVHAFNWADREPGNASLREVLQRTERAVMGGVAQSVIAEGSIEEVEAQVREAITSTGGRRLLIAPGCSVSPGTPVENLEAAARARMAAVR
jgi:uroporphyrinogen decarboxylase